MPGWTDKPWERQKGESEKAFEAFVTYRDMGAERSVTKVSQSLNKSRALIGRWSSQWNWTERVRAYDNELEKEARAKAVKDRKAMTERHIGIAMQMQKKALEALQTLDVEAMSPKDIKEFIKMATDLERLNRELGEADSKAEGGGSARTMELFNKTEIDLNGKVEVEPVQFYMPDNHRDKKRQPVEKT